MRLTDDPTASVAAAIGTWGSRLPQLAALSARRGHIAITDTYAHASITAAGPTGVQSVAGVPPAATMPRT
ncbi:hypothetical protein HIDPHFAB_01068 [Nocardioides sp. T2.26MG-1]|nr:hypothetical protein HIDPHFAB_01068 [Nocardioides sp. T2.26MG-1]